MMFVAVPALAGCSFLPASLKVPPTVPTEIGAPPATGQTITGTGYSFVAPAGWSVPPDMALPGVELFVGNLADPDGFADNVVVGHFPSGRVTPDWIELHGVKELESIGAADVEIRNRVMIAGSESAHLAATVSIDGNENQMEQFYVSNDEQTYIVTFSFSLTVAEPDRDYLAESVLKSWAWL
ncbi:MAG: hypothetical protein ABWX56_00560 [Mycetocola sp.]